jgi:hypothetical protein
MATKSALAAVAAASTVAAEDRANQGPGGPHIDRDVYNDESEVHIRPSGNSRKAMLRRLRTAGEKSATIQAIYQRVLAGELSPHGGMVEAGFRKRVVRAELTAFDQVMKLLPQLSADERAIVHEATEDRPEIAADAPVEMKAGAE